MNKFILILWFLAWSSGAGAVSNYITTSPPPSGLTYGLPSDLGVKDEFIENILKFASESKTNALIILKADKIVVEKYWDQDPDQTIRLHSITKSVLSLGLGKLIYESRLNLSDTAKNWFRDWSGEKEKITIEQLMSQRSGYPESTQEKGQGVNRLKSATDQKTVSVPGAEFKYSNMGAWLLGEVLHQVSKKEADQYLSENFFKPLEIKNFVWEKDDVQHPDTSGGLQLTARDLLKIGQLVLNKGKWNREQLVSEKFIDLATKSGEKNQDYGLLWWADGGNFYARGGFGQILAIYPKEKVILLRLQKTEPRQPVPENSGQGWENRAKQFGNKIRK